MSGKYASNKKIKKKSVKKKSLKGLWIGLIAALLIFGVMLGMALLSSNGEAEVPEEHTVIQSTAAQTTGIQQQASDFLVDDCLEISSLGSYTGIYMEDGSDELVSGIMRIVVTNRAEKPLQYAEITLSGAAGDAVFKVSTLNVGESAVVLEANRKPYASGDSYTEAVASNVLYFTEELSLQKERLEIQPLDGGFNITNISGEDISGDITVYFKDSANGMYYGGITYRGRIEGGMKAGEIKQVMTDNFSASGTAVMFITITE